MEHSLHHQKIRLDRFGGTTKERISTLTIYFDLEQRGLRGRCARKHQNIRRERPAGATFAGCFPCQVAKVCSFEGGTDSGRDKTLQWLVRRSPLINFHRYV